MAGLNRRNGCATGYVYVPILIQRRGYTFIETLDDDNSFVFI